MSELIKEAKKFLFDYLKDKTINYEVIYPWRKDVKFIILHSLRVHAYTLKLFNDHLTPEEQELIEVAALLHDLGRVGETKKGHAKLSKNIVNGWINENQNLFQNIDTIRLLHLIETHSDKDNNDSDICAQILKDADLLDELGVLSIFMQSYKLDHNDPFFFNQLYEKVKNEEIEFCLKTRKLLKTPKAIKILDEKIKFLENFIAHFKDELLGTMDYFITFNQ